MRHAGVFERVEAAQVDRKAVGGELGNLIGGLLGRSVGLASLFECFHKPEAIVAKSAHANIPAHMATTAAAVRHAAPFQPYVLAVAVAGRITRSRRSSSASLFGLLFGASTVYLGLRAGLTVSASIPIAVLAISVLKRLGGSTILENNIVQTIGSAGESVAGGVVFTIPALIFLDAARAAATSATSRSRCWPSPAASSAC